MAFQNVSAEVAELFAECNEHRDAEAMIAKWCEQKRTSRTAEKERRSARSAELRTYKTEALRAPAPAPPLVAEVRRGPGAQPWADEQRAQRKAARAKQTAKILAMRAYWKGRPE